MASSSTPISSHLLDSNLSSLPSDILDTVFWRVLVAPYMPSSIWPTSIVIPNAEGSSPLEDFIDDSRRTQPEDRAVIAEETVPRRNSHDLTAERLRTPLWQPSGKWAWISGMVPEKTIDRLVLKERKRYSVCITTCEINKKTVTYMSKCWPISAHAKTAFNEIQLYKTGLNALQGFTVPNLIQIFIRPGFLNVAFELPHDTFWMEASSDMPSILKKRCLEAFCRLHGQGILHGAVDFSNILIGGDGNVYICDFEASRLITPENTFEAIGEIEKVKRMLYSSEDRGGSSRRPRRFVVPGKSSKELKTALRKFLETLTEPKDSPMQEDSIPPSFPPPPFKGRQRVGNRKDEINNDIVEPLLHRYSLRKRKAKAGPSTETRPSKRGRIAEVSPVEALPTIGRHKKARRGNTARTTATDNTHVLPSRDDELRGDGIIHDSILHNNLNSRFPIIKVRDFGLDNLASRPMYILHDRAVCFRPTGAPATDSRKKRAREDDGGPSVPIDGHSVSRDAKRRRYSAQPASFPRKPQFGLPSVLDGRDRGDSRTKRGRDITAGDSALSWIDRPARGRPLNIKQNTVERNPRTRWWEISKPITRMVALVAGPSPQEKNHYDVGPTDSRGPLIATPGGLGETRGYSGSRWMDRLWSLLP